MRNSKKLLPLVAVALALVAISPAAYASTLTITLNPSNETATINATSTTDLILTYPANSTLSDHLNGTSTSVTLSGSFHSESPEAHALQSSLDDESPDLRVVNANFTYTLTAKGNTTTFVLSKETTISAVITGAFEVVNGTIHANMGWKAFAIKGPLLLDLQSRVVDVNEVGSAFSMQLGDKPYALDAVLGMFGGDSLWHASTIDYSSLRAPLSTWTSHYDAGTNTTTYTKTINTESSLNASASINGQTFTLSIRSDPSAQIVVEGYASASGDSLVVQRAPAGVAGIAGLDPAVWVAAGAVVLMALGGAFYLMRRSRARPASWMQNLQSTSS